MLRTVSTHNSYTVVNQDYLLVDRYLNIYPITLGHIYTLTREAAATNSLYISFTTTKAGTAFTYFEFEFDNLGLSSFEIENGEQIPCYLSGDFVQVSGRSLAPICKGYTNGLDEDSPLIIRVLRIASFSASRTFEIAFDEFSNPAVEVLHLVPINVRISQIDRTNNKVYTSNFPQVSISDSWNRGIPTQLGGSQLYRSNANRGSSDVQFYRVDWPYSSNFNDISEKVVMKIRGGITCCNNYDDFYLDDNRTSPYNELWTDKVANITVYRTPSHSTGGYDTQIEIKNVVNPYPYQKETYEQIK